MRQPNLADREWQKIRQDLSPENDFPPTACRFKYLICSTPRSGSTLLSTGLASTGRAGRPLEYLSQPYGVVFKERNGRLLLPEYWRFLVTRRTTPNGVFGMKMHFDQFANNLGGEAAQKEFLNQFDLIIWLTRRDKLGQAVSYYKARTSGIYRVFRGEAPAPQVGYDFHGIGEALGIIAAQEAGWRAALAELPGKILPVKYEDLASAYADSMRRLLGALGLRDAMASLDPAPRLARQRDRSSELWERQFMLDLRGLRDGWEDAVPFAKSA